jgi:membrane protease YdiL (CAAX protease family)
MGAGLLVLGLRAYTPFGVPMLAVTYLALASLAVVPSDTDVRPRVHPLLVIGAGLSAVWLAGSVAGPALPVVGVTGAALGLNTLAAVGEEAFFRKFMYDRASRWGPAVAIGVTALVFAAIHVPAYGVAAFPVDLGAGLLLGWQRWASGTWLAPAATHAFANLLAVLR